jgi:hypothetical protein
LHLHPVAADFRADPVRDRGGAWFGQSEWQHLGLPAPIRRLLDSA